MKELILIAWFYWYPPPPIDYNLPPIHNDPFQFYYPMYIGPMLPKDRELAC
jgi:hypothetical protein